MASLENQLTIAALNYLGETAGKRSAQAIWRAAMIKRLGGGADLGRLSLGALAARTARAVVGEPLPGLSLDALLLRWAYKVAGPSAPGGLSLPGAAAAALSPAPEYSFITRPDGTFLIRASGAYFVRAV